MGTLELDRGDGGWFCGLQWLLQAKVRSQKDRQESSYSNLPCVFSQSSNKRGTDTVGREKQQRHM